MLECGLASLVEGRVFLDFTAKAQRRKVNRKDELLWRNITSPLAYPATSQYPHAHEDYSFA
jgi:hypothetical protein